MTIRSICRSGASTVHEINGEFRVRVTPGDDGHLVAVSMARTRRVGEAAAARLEQVARQRGALVRIEPIIDGAMLVAHDHLWQAVLDEVAEQRLWSGTAEELSIEGAHRAICERLEDAGGELPWDEVVPETMEAECFPLGYRGRDAIKALLANGTLEQDRKSAVPRCASWHVEAAGPPIRVAPDPPIRRARPPTCPPMACTRSPSRATRAASTGPTPAAASARRRRAASRCSNGPADA
ncbi:MAG: hypothetical protein IPL61_27440 [Myxococcales bacterium]|nr:hypothetical protein [Myxococcales bacterium]